MGNSTYEQSEPPRFNLNWSGPGTTHVIADVAGYYLSY